MGAEPSTKKELTLSQAVSAGYVALARLAVLANIYLIASAGQAVANKVFQFNGKLFENPLTGPETAAAINMYKWATLTGPRLLSEALAKNDVHRFNQVQKTTANFADMVLKEVPATFKDNALYDWVINVFVKTVTTGVNPSVWPLELKIAVGVFTVAGAVYILGGLKAFKDITR
jgi:hypothetical protein